MMNNASYTETTHLLKRISSGCLYLHGIAATIFLLAFLFFPDTNAMAVSCGTLAVFVSLFPVFFAISKKRFPLLFSCISIFNIAPIWFLYLEAILPGYDAYTFISPSMRIYAFFWISLFQFFVNLFYTGFRKPVNRFSIRSFSFLNVIKLKPVFYIRATIFVFIIPLVFFYFFYGSAAVLWTAMTSGRSEGGGGATGLLVRESLGDSNAFMMPLIWIWQLTPLFGSIAFIAARKTNRFLAFISLLLGLLVVFVFFLSGSRGTMIFVAAPALFFFFYYNWDRGIKFWVPAITVLILLIGVMELQVRFRGNLLDVIADPSKAAKLQGLDAATTFDPTQSHRDNNMYLFCLMVKGYPDKYAYEGFNDFFAVLANPIPRAIWPGKPVLIGSQDLSHQSGFILDGPLYMGTSSLSYSIVGDAYKTSGLFGIIVYAFVYALFLLYFDGVIYYTQQKQPLPTGILSIGIFLSFWGYRAFFALVSFLYPILLLLIILRIMKLFKGNANYVHST